MCLRIAMQVANTVVGDAKKRGLSGGEKKRLSLGCELVGSPPLIFLDGAHCVRQGCMH
jgi:ABC-type multidrug transport system ATPase subunit